MEDLEAGPARNEQDPAVERQLSVEQGEADQLVHRVVPAHVFPEGDQAALRVEQARRVQSAGAVEDPLGFPQVSGNPMRTDRPTTGPGRTGGQRTAI